MSPGCEPRERASGRRASGCASLGDVLWARIRRVGHEPGQDTKLPPPDAPASAAGRDCGSGQAEHRSRQSLADVEEAVDAPIRGASRVPAGLPPRPTTTSARSPRRAPRTRPASAAPRCRRRCASVPESGRRLPASRAAWPAPGGRAPARQAAGRCARQFAARRHRRSGRASPRSARRGSPRRRAAAAGRSRHAAAGAAARRCPSPVARSMPRKPCSTSSMWGSVWVASTSLPPSGRSPVCEQRVQQQEGPAEESGQSIELGEARRLDAGHGLARV